MLHDVIDTARLVLFMTGDA